MQTRYQLRYAPVELRGYPTCSCQLLRLSHQKLRTTKYKRGPQSAVPLITISIDQPREGTEMTGVRPVELKYRNASA